MKKELLKYLKHPTLESNFKYDSSKNTLIDKVEGEVFRVVEKIPILFPKEERELNIDIKGSDLNKNFKYIDHYLKDAEEFDYYRKITGATAHSRRRIEETILSEIEGEFDSILDVGCGRAWVAKNYINTNSHVVSFDIAIANTVKALKKYPANNHFAVVGDALNPPLKKNTFDYIVASEIIEHVADPAKFVNSLFALLKPSGKLIITTPYNEKLKYSMCIHCNKKTPHNAHIHSFNEDKLFALHNQIDLKKVVFRKFSNKIIDYLRLYKIFNILNYKLWKLVDDFYNFIFNKPIRIMVVFEKK